MSNQFAFVVVGDSGKTRSADRSVIRSRCMKGKNRQEGSRRSLQAARKALKTTGSLQTVEHERGSRSVPSNSSRSSTDNPSRTRRARKYRQPPTTEDSSEDDLIALKDPTPSLPPTDICLVRFADDLERPSQEVLFRLFSSATLKETFYPVEHIVNLPRSPNSEALSFSWILQDQIFLHSILFCSSAIQDRTKYAPSGKLTQFHLRRTISLLNKSLSQKNSYENEAIFHVILTLAMIASLWGDFDSAAVHLSGLQQIVRLRGGLEYLHRFPKLHFKLDRLALTWALGSGGIPSFFTGPVSWSPYFERSPETRTNTIEVGLIEVFADIRLAIVFRDLRHLVCLVNNHLANNSRVDGLLFQDCLGSVQARLVHLQGDLEDASDECLRLGMLAFLSTTLQIPGGKFPYAYLAAKFRMACKNFIIRTPVHEKLLFWMLIVGSISVFEPDELSLRSVWFTLAYPKLSWHEARSTLQTIMWIDSMHGTMGQSAFSKARELGNGATEAILEP
ncbi:unnamed protein product [Colletotrichum noveboracense]|uniref:C6 zinc finger domain-containing protein n=1 Tax=Colletotrichum noveboracense TaxID=2664923 RepID=A0A9W4RPF5_9PEZI|nr:hypothetical protein K456DRAFT_47133 [Colletotrichum gloeosporioides 23]CAI0645160.1 unnamed protein product [Colletotrichum noveboracense]